MTNRYDFAELIGKANEAMTGVRSYNFEEMIGHLSDGLDVASGVVIASPGGRYPTVQAALDAAVALTPSATNPVTIVLAAGVYAESVTMPITASYVDIVSMGATWQSTTAGPALTIDDGTNHVQIKGVKFAQPTASGYRRPLVQLGTAGNELLDSTSPQYIVFDGCQFDGTQGPAIVGYGHELHFINCRGWWACNSGAQTQDVMLSDGNQTNNNVHLWTISAAFSGLGGSITNLRWPSSYGTAIGEASQRVTTSVVNATGIISYKNIPYAATRTSGANVNYLAGWVKSSAAGDVHQIKIYAAVAMGGSLLATVTVPTLKADKWRYICVPVSGVAGVAIGSFAWATTANANCDFDTADLWLQAGVWGTHEHVLLKTLRGSVSSGWWSFDNCLWESRDYNAEVSAVGCVEGVCSLIDLGSMGTGDTIRATQVNFIGGKFYMRNVGTGAGNFGLTTAGVARVAANCRARFAGSGLQVFVSGTNAKCHPLQNMPDDETAAALYGVVSAVGCNWDGSSAWSTFSCEIGYNQMTVKYGVTQVMSFFVPALTDAVVVPIFNPTVDGAGTKRRFGPFRLWRVTASATSAETSTLDVVPYLDGAAQATWDANLSATGAQTVIASNADGGAGLVYAQGADFGLKVTPAKAWTNLAITVEIEPLPDCGV
jgi:hypothetical protein